MTADARNRLLATSDGVETVLEPLDALYVPMLMWHAADYVDDGMSFNIRFGRNAYNTFLSDHNLLADRHQQCVSYPFGAVPPEATAPPDMEAVFDEISSEYSRHHASHEDRLRSVRRRVRRIHERLDPEAAEDLRDGALRRREERFIDEKVADAKSRYRDSRGGNETVGPCTRRQAELVTSAFETLGYDDTTRSAVLFNKFGRRSVEALAHDDATLLLEYLGSFCGQIHAQSLRKGLLFRD